jgi:hypothetical protein
MEIKLREREELKIYHAKQLKYGLKPGFESERLTLDDIL